MSADSFFQRLWYGPAWRALPLWPLSGLFLLLSSLRRALFRLGTFETVRVSRPVIVVGNLTVGGTGKTPLTIWLARQLTRRGLRVGIITRGYGGHSKIWPQRVHADSDPQQLGDEAVLLATETQAIVCAGPDRVAAAKLAINEGAELILSDDGLQHYRLHRDGEFAVVDGSRVVGNGWPLPAGPLRELPGRLRSVSAMLVNDRTQTSSRLPLENGLPVPCWHYRLRLGSVMSFDGSSQPLSALAGRRVNVVTAIGHPDAFLHALQQAGVHVAQVRKLPDHAAFTPADIHFDNELPVLMTGKDAVKCRAFTQAHHHWVSAEVDFALNDALQLLDCVDRLYTAATLQLSR